MGYGPAKLRAKVTQVIRDVDMQFFIDNDQADALDDFYINTLRRTGVFNWIDHRTGDAALYKFLQPPAVKPYGTALYWDVTLKLEMTLI